MSWKEYRVGDLVEQVRGVSYKKDEIFNTKLSGSIGILKANNISNDFQLNENDLLYITSSKIKPKQVLRKGDILIAASSGSIKVVGKGASYNLEGEHTFGAFCKVLRPKSDLVRPELLSYYFQTEKYRETISNLARGANINNLKNEHIDDLLIPLPDLHTQQQTVAVLDKAQSLIRKREQSIQLLDDLLKATFLDMFGDPVLNEKGWELTTLSKLGKWHSGGTPSRSIDKYFKGTIPWYSSGELNNVYTRSSKEKISSEAIKETSAKLIEEGSLLIGMYDTAALKSSITTEKASCNQAIAFAKLDDKKCSTLYTYYAIQIGKEHYLTQRRGVRQRNLNLSMVKNFELPLPKITLQREFETQVLKIFNLKNKITTGFLESINLFQSLLQDAFAGKLKLEEDLPLEVILEHYQLGETNKQEKDRNQELIQLLANSTEKSAAFKKSIDTQDFENLEEYEKSKAVLFEVLNAPKSKLEQLYDPKNKKVVLN